MAPTVDAAELLLSLVFFLLVVAASHPPTAAVGNAALLLYLAADGRRGERRSHAAARSQDWWIRCVPAMHDDEFERTFRVPRAVFFSIVAAATLSGVFTSALAHVPQLAISLQVAMALYKYVVGAGKHSLLISPSVAFPGCKRRWWWGGILQRSRERRLSWYLPPGVFLPLACPQTRPPHLIFRPCSKIWRVYCSRSHSRDDALPSLVCSALHAPADLQPLANDRGNVC